MNDLLFELVPLAGKGYCCSQIMLLLALQRQGRQNPGLVRAMGGLCMGVGSSGGTCGVLTGAACLLALYAAKGTDDENEHERLPLMYAELNEWFQQEVGTPHGGTDCRDILGEDRRRPDPGICGRILAETYQRVTAILTENGLDPTAARRGADD